MNNDKLIVIFGCGFVGRQITQTCLDLGFRIRVALRRPHLYQNVKTSAKVGQLTFCQANVRNLASVENAIIGADYVINTVGIFHEHGKQKFQAIHVDAASHIAKSCKKFKVKKLIHFSCLLDEKNLKSKFLHSKYKAESKILANFSNAVIIRPSLIFGINDHFFNKFAKLATYSKIIPLVFSGHKKHQPVYISDICNLLAKIIQNDNNDKQAKEIIECFGPKVYCQKELIKIILTQTNRNALLVPIPIVFGYVLGFLSQLLAFVLPVFKPFVTIDEVRCVKTNDLSSENSKYKSLKDFEINQTDLLVILPLYLWRFRSEGEFQKKQLV